MRKTKSKRCSSQHMVVNNGGQQGTGDTTSVRTFTKRASNIRSNLPR